MREMTDAARTNYVAVVAGVCRCLEDLAQEARLVQAGQASGEDVKRAARALLYDRQLEEDLAAAEVLVGAEGASKKRILAVEALESIIDGLRDGMLTGARQERVAARLELAEDQLLGFLACLPQDAVREAEDIVERENAANSVGFEGIFPWRMDRREVSGPASMLETEIVEPPEGIKMPQSRRFW